MMSITATIPPTVAPVTAAIGTSIVIQNYKLTSCLLGMVQQ